MTLLRWDIDDVEIRGVVLPGASLGELVAALGEPDGKFKRTLDDSNVIVAYESLGLHASIDQNNSISCLSVFPRNEVYIGGVQVLGERIEEVRKKISHCFHAEMEDAGLWIGKLDALLIEAEGVVDAVELYERAAPFARPAEE